MRRRDQEELAREYRPDESHESGLSRRLGVHVAEVQELANMILGDLDSETYGIRWWREHLGTKQRIATSDYLWQLVTSIPLNLTEAAIHLWEARGAWEQENARLRNSLRATPTIGGAWLPPLRSPGDELPGALAQLHVAGFFRAIGSTLDCIGGAVIGVGGLKQNLLRADLEKARRALRKLDSSIGNARQVALGARLEEIIQDVGPDGWLDWATDYRNMLVHRGRRITGVVGVRQDAGIVDASGQTIPSFVGVPMLSIAPARSEVEVLVRHDRQQYIEEDGERVLAGILDSVRCLVRQTSTLLAVLWAERRVHPDLILQPQEQWPEVTCPDVGFVGYAPGSLSVPTRGTMTVSPAFETRLRAAALFADRRSEWDDFD